MLIVSSFSFPTSRPPRPSVRLSCHSPSISCVSFPSAPLPLLHFSFRPPVFPLCCPFPSHRLFFPPSTLFPFSSSLFYFPFRVPSPSHISPSSHLPPALPPFFLSIPRSVLLFLFPI